jgi:hypothetical protein
VSAKTVIFSCALAWAGSGLAGEAKVLSPALAKPLAQALNSLKSLPEGVSKNAAAAVAGRMEALKLELKTALGQLRKAKVSDGDAEAKDASVVAVAGALRAADLIGKGLKKGDPAQLQIGLSLAQLARADLEALQAPPVAAVAPIPKADGYTIGPSIGGNLAYTSQPSAMNAAADFSVSYPMTEASDVGLGLSVNATRSSSNNGGYYGARYSVDFFTRFHFLELFRAAPWVVPYVGAKMGVTMNRSSAYDASSSTAIDSGGDSFGFQAGTLFFISKKTAVSAQVEDSVETTQALSSSTRAVSNGSLTLSLGLRMMF